MESASGINLRDEAMKFIRQVQETLSLNPDAQNVADQLVYDVEARTSFMDNVFVRFPPEDDHLRMTFANLLNIVYRSDAERPKAYADVCVLLIGHADLFRQFEQLLDLNDAEIANWRFQVREKLMREIDVLIGRCRMTIEAIWNEPKNLTGEHQDCIERLFYSEIPNQIEREEKMRMLAMETDRYLRYVLPVLKTKLDILQKVREFVSNFFVELHSLGGAGYQP